jgi:SAM-dependent methyltransferase
LTIADIGGAAGIHAGWLAGQGHRVHLVDSVPLHVEQARDEHPAVSAQVGDARQLDLPSDGFDAVLLLGPLYHLVDREDRGRALREAARILRPNGWLFAAGIARFAALFDLLIRLDRLHDPDVMHAVEEAVATGVLRDAPMFTTAYFHLPQELVDEVSEAAFAEPEIFSIEGPGYLVGDFERRWADPASREALLAAARLTESEPSGLAAASHLLVVARAASTT